MCNAGSNIAESIKDFDDNLRKVATEQFDDKYNGEEVVKYLMEIESIKGEIKCVSKLLQTVGKALQSLEELKDLKKVRSKL